MYAKNLIIWLDGIFWLSVILPFVLINTACHDNNPIKPHSPHPAHPVHPSHPVISPDTVEVATTDTIFIDVPFICNLVDLTVAGDVIIDKSGPNVYAFKRNNIEEARAILDTTTTDPTIITIIHTFENYNLLADIFSIKVVKGSRADVISVGVIKMECVE